MNYKIILSTIFLIGSISFSNAQIIGVKGGLNASNFYSDEVDDKNARYGFHAGLFSQWEISEGLGLQTEILYSGKGNRSMYDGIIDQEVKFNMHYIDVPVMAVFKLGDAAEIHTGVYGGYLLSTDITSDGDLGEYSDSVDKDNFKSFDWGFLGGIGINFGNLQVGARYNLGMMKIADSDGAKSLIGDAKNSYGQIYGALRIK
ncbi:porin family protein [Marinigracilibium pacificum]|uniref:PorT family protein n=1 Tax=Marinigracilibium pacificum TaxID=2729599 RepID=A0A848J519_9BACT|nr:porin family protein [Marinigracilibium pacificum]NMM49610.1 PorT family protein [Marinigracilibium pacificum]